MSGQSFRLVHAAARQNAIAAIQQAPDGWVVDIKEPKRSDLQNRLMWSLLGQISKAEPGGRQASPEVWKQLFMHALGHSVVFQMGLNNEVFPTGFRSSALSVKEMADLITFIQAWAAEQGIALAYQDGFDVP